MKNWRRMENSKKLVCRPVVLIYLLLVVPLVYSAFLLIDHWEEDSRNWDDNYIGTRNVHEELKFLLRKLVKEDDQRKFEATGFACLYDVHSNVYVTSKEVRLDTSSSPLKIYIYSNQTYLREETQPYALKGDQTAMASVKHVQIHVGNITSPPPPPAGCDYVHPVPAVVFSSGGFVRNIFHEINDIIIPLFITSRHFRSNVRFVVTDFQLWFINRYKNIISQLSRYDIIDIDSTDSSSSSSGSVFHCFPGAVVGLKYHDNLSLNATDIPGGYYMFQFRNLLMKSYNFKKRHVSQIEKPVLLLISRTKRRKMINQKEVVKMVKKLGFHEVVTATPKEMEDLDKFAGVVNLCSVMVGVHGAGLTNELFLPNGAVVVQVVPLGLDWAANAYYGAPARDMGLQYLEYKIEPQESSLYHIYGPDDPIISDPESTAAKGYRAFREVYLDKQNVKINVARFRKILVKALKLTRGGD